MDSSKLSTENLLAAALRDEAVEPPNAGAADIAALVEAATYHGIAGLLIERTEVIRSWPDELVEPLTVQARAQAMWEMRHRQVLSALLAALAEKQIPNLLMKGTAVAYDLYDNPSARSRGDTDLLIPARDVHKAKTLFAKLGYAEGVLGGVDAEFALQQPWIVAPSGGGQHCIDLHWQVMNAPSLNGLLGFAECHANAQSLPRLSPEAKAMDRVRLLIHTCLHRAVHRNTPYVVDGVAYYDSGRLIWTHDIHLLASANDDGQWSRFVELAQQMRVSRVCLEGLEDARGRLRTKIPASVLGALHDSAEGDRDSAYFYRSRPVHRAWQDMMAIPGLARKMRYARARIVPDARFVRAKYPTMAKASLPLLYARRLAALVRSRRGGRQR